MSAFGAMLVDAYRELNSKKLFWIILTLSALVVVYFASVGFDENGMSMFFGLIHVENPLLTRDSPMSVMLYRSIFASFIVGIWLAWIATILALISTSTIFPDFVAGGAIDLVLCKPIGRVKLFAMKYATSLLFVLLQVTIFCVGVFLCMGLRLDDWEWKIFAAIPVVTLFYSYLFSVTTLFGVWTRSALAALLVTMLFWVSLFGINFSETLLTQIKLGFTVQRETVDESIARSEAMLAEIEARADEDAAPHHGAPLRTSVERERERRDEMQEFIDKLDKWHRPVRVVQRIAPKTSETIGLLDRWLRRDTDVNLMDLLTGNVERDAAGGFRSTDESNDREVVRRMEEEYMSRSGWYIVGTSLIFEGVVLSLACLIFVRRDY